MEKNNHKSNMVSIEEYDALHRYYQKIIGCMPNNVYWLDNNCITQGCNDNVLKLIGLNSIDEFIGINYKRMGELAGWTEGQAASFERDDKEVIASGIAKLNVEEPPVYDKEGNPRYYMSSRVPIFDKNQEIVGVVGISVDITDRKEKEKLIVEAETHQAQIAEQKKFYNLAAQVAHDIRSPLQVLDSLVSSMKNRFSDKESHIISDAIKRINDIAAGLLTRYRQDNNPEVKTISAYPLWLVLLKLIDEKKIALHHQHSDIKLNLQTPADKTVSAKFDITELQRIVSNVINNAVDAFKHPTQSEKSITVSLNMISQMAIIEIRDTAGGIDIKRVASFNETGKIDSRGGHGLGLSHAYHTIKRWGGDIKMDSVLSQGTTMKIFLPSTLPPSWLRLNLHLQQNTSVYLVDDDEVTLHRLSDILVKKGIAKNNIKSYSSLEKFITNYDKINIESSFVFLDQIFIKTEELGIDVLVKKGITTNSALITNDFLDNTLKHKAIDNGIRLIPKPLFAEITINFEENNITAQQAIEYVVLDDLESVTDYWELKAAEKDIAIKTFNNSLDFMDFIKTCPKNTKIYLDNDLGEELSGLDLSKKLYELGYTELHMMTSRDDISTDEYPWLTAVVSKKVPFDE